MDEISRMEKILRGDPIEPITRLEKFCAKAAGTYTGDPLTPVTRLEWFLDQISGGGGGGETKATNIVQVSDLYSGPVHYTRSAKQQLEAPEGIVWDKVWIADEFISQFGNQKDYLKHYFQNSVPNHANYLSYRTTMETYCCNNVPSAGIPNGFFAHNTAFNTLVLYNESLCKLSNIGVFNDTPFASGGTGGTLYVPSALISTYQSATNWSTILGYASNQIKAIEGSEWE